MKEVPLMKLIELCKAGNEEAKKEFKFRYDIEWDELQKDAEKIKVKIGA
nr:hypothetical protein 27 [Bacillales bacterium]